MSSRNSNNSMAANESTNTKKSQKQPQSQEKGETSKDVESLQQSQEATTSEHDELTEGVVHTVNGPTATASPNTQKKNSKLLNLLA